MSRGHLGQILSGLSLEVNNGLGVCMWMRLSSSPVVPRTPKVHGRSLVRDTTFREFSRPRRGKELYTNGLIKDLQGNSFQPPS